MTRSMAMATSAFSSIRFTYSHLMEHHRLLQDPMLCFLFVTLSFVSLFVVFISMFRRLKRTKKEEEEEEDSATAEISIQNPHSIFSYSQPNTTGEAHQSHPLIVDILSSDPSKLASFISSIPSHLPLDDSGNRDVIQLSDVSKGDSDGIQSAVEDSVKTGDSREKKKKKRAKKKRQNSTNAEYEFLRSQVSLTQDKNDLDCLYPFTSLSSVTQKKIKQQYDQLVKANDSQALTLAQVCHFANCLIEARNELKHKSGINQRKLTITKALLFKADRSSFDRLCQQVYKLDAEQKRLEEDAIVYNRLQEQLKLSPAYKKMLEIGSLMELKAGSNQLEETRDPEFADISFEELLAQEKKDAFWQKNGKLRSCTS
ncbi:hypothetical protein NE237_029236 [Protea cynaroides]|uniref:AT1G17665-like protein n=1 Tax=Protea cynaroides TaxID=273540 RepID=A0A9Q0GVF8_9MAGN|nr:hypothetical protein NE237_029236 [Protea cynaroides]